MRDYGNFDKYIDNLQSDVYEQPPDEGHKDFAKASIVWANKLIKFNQVLDVGCGQGFCKPIFKDLGIHWKGVTIGKDYEACKKKGLDVYNSDVSFLDMKDGEVDTVFARHILEHSPFPILTLMEWKRVARNWLILVYPAHEYWGVGGRNHYYVLDKERLWYNLTRAGWYPLHEKELMTSSYLFNTHYPSKENWKEASYPGAPIPNEYWYICKKGKERID